MNHHGIHGIHGRRRWWRSPSFWLAGFGLGFLIWAWVDSNHRTSTLEHSPSRVTISSTHGHLLTVQLSDAATSAGLKVDSWLAVVFLSASHSPPSAIQCYFGPARPLPVWDFYQAEIHPVQRTWFPPLRSQSSEDSATPFALLAIPYWLLVTAYLGVWWGAFLWSRRRRSTAWVDPEVA
jgi:hypothetical protein